MHKRSGWLDYFLLKTLDTLDMATSIELLSQAICNWSLLGSLQEIFCNTSLHYSVLFSDRNYLREVSFCLHLHQVIPSMCSVTCQSDRAILWMLVVRFNNAMWYSIHTFKDRALREYHRRHKLSRLHVWTTHSSHFISLYNYSVQLAKSHLKAVTTRSISYLIYIYQTTATTIPTNSARIRHQRPNTYSQSAKSTAFALSNVHQDIHPLQRLPLPWGIRPQEVLQPVSQRPLLQTRRIQTHHSLGIQRMLFPAWRECVRRGSQDCAQSCTAEIYRLHFWLGYWDPRGFLDRVDENETYSAWIWAHCVMVILKWWFMQLVASVLPTCLVLKA